MQKENKKGTEVIFSQVEEVTFESILNKSKVFLNFWEKSSSGPENKSRPPSVEINMMLIVETFKHTHKI